MKYEMYTLLYLWYPLFQVQWDKCDHHSQQTMNYSVYGHHYYRAEVRVIIKLPNTEQSSKGKVKTTEHRAIF